MLLRAVAVILVGLLLFPSGITPVYAEGAIIGERIDNLGLWLRGQKASHGSVVGFRHGVSDTSEDTRFYSEDNALVTLALASYHDTRNSEAFDEQLKTAVGFLLLARASKGDFYQYYDPAGGAWKKSGRLYDWNSYVVAGLAYSAYVMASLMPSERSYWLMVGRAAGNTITRWGGSSQDPTGAWAFYSDNGTRLVRIDSNGALLAGLSYLALLERSYGDNSTASEFATYAQRVAGWLVSQHESAPSSWGYGGLYTDTSRSRQEMRPNTLALFGLNSYYKVIGLLTRMPSPSVEEVRSLMVAWMDHYVASMVDSTWGPFSSRTLNSVVPYPKLVSSSGWLMRAAADIWINIGTLDYQLQTGQMYEWLTGRNEHAMDLQSAWNWAGQGGGFLLGIGGNGIINTTSTPANAEAMFGMLHGSLISIPEFQMSTTLVSVILLACAIAFFRRRHEDARGRFAL